MAKITSDKGALVKKKEEKKNPTKPLANEPGA
jgi:hypothetical protein